MLSAAGEVPQHPTWLDSTQIYSTRFPSFSITTKYHLNVGGVIIERLPESMFTFLYTTQTQHNEAMVYLLLGLWLSVRLRVKKSTGKE